MAIEHSDAMLTGLALTAWIAMQHGTTSRKVFVELAGDAWDIAVANKEEALRNDGSTPSHPRADGSYGWPQARVSPGEEPTPK